MGLKDALGSMHRCLGKHAAVVHVAVKIRNQCNGIIRYHLGEDNDVQKNGEAWLADVVGRSASTFIDVGANVGEWAALFMNAMPNGTGVLIDASSQAVRAIAERFRNEPRINVIHAAVSDTPGEAEFFEESNSGKTSSLLRSFTNSTAHKKIVRVTTVDAEAKAHNVTQIDMLKIDAEGYDLHVLRGASGLLSQQAIGVVQFEYNSCWADIGSTLGAAINLLRSHQYDVYLLKSTGLVPVNYRYFGEFFEYSNFVGVAPHKKNLFPSLPGQTESL
jgi:FkbM family methyltransferase